MPRNGRKSIIGTLYSLARHSQIVEVVDSVSKTIKLDVNYQFLFLL